jgi:tetraprenyl-beta-curcumene synthase
VTPVPLVKRRTTHPTGALLLANVRYWTQIAPLVRTQLERWEQRAQMIVDPELRTLALTKLRGESFNAEAAAMLATRAARAQRGHVVEAIVALELLFDYLDGLTERPSPDPLGEGTRLFEAFTDAIEPPCGGAGRTECDGSRAGDGGYLEELSDAARTALAQLPAADAVRDVARRAVARGAQAQIRMHATAVLGTAQLEAWARGEATQADLGWRELLAGAASSVLVVHALIAAAADPHTTPAEADEIATAYLAICVLLTLLDSLVDEERDARAGQRGYVSFYEDRELLALTLADVARRADGEVRALRGGAHHAMLLVGVVAFYTSAPGAADPLAAPIARRLHAELGPLILPTLAVMHAWRLAKRISTRKRRRLMRAASTAAVWIALGAAVGVPAYLASPAPTAQAARIESVRDEGHLRFKSSSGSWLTDEGPIAGSIRGRARVSFDYDGSPTVAAHFTIYASDGSITGRARGRLSDPTSLSPSFRGSLSITGGSGRYARARGSGELFGVFYRRNYALTVQAIGSLRYSSAAGSARVPRTPSYAQSHTSTQVAQSAKITAAFLPESLGAATTVSLGFQIHGGRGLPSPLTGIDFRYPANLGIVTSGLGVAACNPASLEVHGPSACPANSVIGHGGAVVEVPLGPEVVVETAKLVLFAGPSPDGYLRLLVSATGLTPVAARIVMPTLLLAGHLHIAVPLVASLPGGPDVAVVRVRVTLGGHLTYYERAHGKTVAYHPKGILLPQRCPYGGFRFAATFAFRDGSDTHARTKVACPGQR